ncbi:hypothetical protein [Aliihoeflea sp. 40Bstr573]|uniref:hypothetical protein n=1 Tax=Aliihoeflea sp. 40Bstr573 TaxID=2696467 RepID=UPI00209607EB|nr:hypothetical protein [Aliihoeflea sp. 40Bstr573]MCO6386003.1 hypothetical protein [Aliihoeflea sp. 40Bstr573]
MARYREWKKRDVAIGQQWPLGHGDRENRKTIQLIAVPDAICHRRIALKVSDAERAEDLLRMAGDKRLTYRMVRKPVTPKQKARKLLSRLKHKV